MSMIWEDQNDKRMFDAKSRNQLLIQQFHRQNSGKSKRHKKGKAKFGNEGEIYLWPILNLDVIFERWVR